MRDETVTQCYGKTHSKLSNTIMMMMIMMMMMMRRRRRRRRMLAIFINDYHNIILV